MPQTNQNKVNLNMQVTQAENGFIVQITGMQQQKHFIAADMPAAGKIVVDFMTALTQEPPAESVPTPVPMPVVGA